MEQGKENKEQKEQKQKTEPKVKAKSLTFFMLPFYFESEDPFNQKKQSSIKNGLWKLECEKVSNEGEDGEVLYPYIMSFLQGQMMEDFNESGYTKNSDENNKKKNLPEHLKIYRLYEWSQNADIPLDSFLNKFFSQSHTAHTKDGSIDFKFISNKIAGFKSPHVFVLESAKIGILSFCIEIASKTDITFENVEMINYELRKIGKGQRCKCTSPVFRISDRAKSRFEIAEDDDEETKSIKQKEKEESESKIYSARSFIGAHDNTKCDPYMDFSWNMSTFIDFLIKDYELIYFCKNRLPLFTYFQTEEVETINQAEVLPHLLRLSRCVNSKYLLSVEKLIQNDAVLQTFDNIYMSASVEGTAIVSVPTPANKSFISSMDGNIRNRYLWIYLLTMIQRYTLLNMERRLIDVEAQNDDNQLWEKIEIIKKAKVHCFFTDVSVFTQHNQFYLHCCKHLHINSLFDEIDAKTKALNLTISHDIQKQLIKQENIIKEQDIISEKQQRRLAIVVAGLTVAQVADAIYSISGNNIIFGLLSALIAIIAICVIFIDDIKKAFNN